MTFFRNAGTVLIVTGIILIIVGLLFRYTNILSWLGRLPGDFRIEGENYTVYIPVTTILIISFIVNILIRIFKK